MPSPRPLLSAIAVTAVLLPWAVNGLPQERPRPSAADVSVVEQPLPEVAGGTTIIPVVTSILGTGAPGISGSAGSVTLRLTVSTVIGRPLMLSLTSTLPAFGEPTAPLIGP